MVKITIEKKRTILFLTLIIFAHCLIFISNTSWNFEKGGADWPQSCKDGNQAPIDISAPFTYKPLNISFSYQNMMTEYLFYNDGNNLLLEGDFGYLVYNNVTYFSSQVRFYNPSMHTFNNNRMPFELQVIHQDSNKNQISVSILFRYSNDDYSIFLSKLGFDDTSLQYQQAFQPKAIQNEIHLENFINNSKEFFAYKSELFLPPCDGDSMNFIVTDVMKISKKQIENFPKLIFQQNRIIQERNDREIFTSFKQEDVNAKVKQNSQQVQQQNNLDKQNKLLAQINDINQNGNGTLGNSTNSNSTISNSTTNNPDDETDNIYESSIDKQLEKVINSANGNCSKSQVPLDEVEGQVNAFNSAIRASDPKLINVQDNGQILNPNFPISVDVKKSKEIDQNFIKYQQVLKNVTESINNNANQASLQNSFIQIKKLEKIFKEENYQPYLNLVEINSRKKIKTKSFLRKSFLQINSDNNNNDKKGVFLGDNNFDYDDFDKEFNKEKVNNNSIFASALEFNKKSLTPNYASYFEIDKEDNLVAESPLEKLDKKISMNFLQTKTKTKNEFDVERIKDYFDIRGNIVNFNDNDNFNDDVKDNYNNLISGNIKKDLESFVENFSIDKSGKSLVDNDKKNGNKNDNEINENKNDNEIKENKINENKENKRNIDNKEKKINISNKEKKNNNYNKDKNKKNEKEIKKNNIHNKYKKNIKKSNIKKQVIIKKPLNKSKQIFQKISEEINLNNNFKFTNLILNSLIEDLTLIDQIENKAFDNPKAILSNGSFIKLTRSTLAAILKVSNLIENLKTEFTLDEENKYKIAKEIILKIIILQLKNDNKNFVEIFPKKITEKDIEHISQYVKLAFEDKKVNLNEEIKDIIAQSPIILFDNEEIKKDKNNSIEYLLKFTYEEFKQKFSNLKTLNKNSNNIEPEITNFLKKLFELNTNTTNDINDTNLSEKKNKTIFGAVLSTEKIKEKLIEIPGKGRKAINKKGIIDNTNIFNTNSWPKSCKTGFQSPINISDEIPKKNISLEFNFNKISNFSSISNDGFKLILTNNNFGSFNFTGKIYQAKTIEIHHSSEHTFGENEERSPLEMQIISQDKEGNLAGISVLFNKGKNDNDILSLFGLGIDNKIFGNKLRNKENILLDHRKMKNLVDLNKYFKDEKSFYHYKGSQTSPPCKPVMWFILTKKFEVSDNQLFYFPILFGRNTNVRGLQKMGEKRLFK